MGLSQMHRELLEELFSVSMQLDTALKRIAELEAERKEDPDPCISSTLTPTQLPKPSTLKPAG
jgi:hypothetical protein